MPEGYTYEYRRVNTLEYFTAGAGEWDNTGMYKVREFLQAQMRADKTLSENEISRRTGVPQPTINRILRGKLKEQKAATVRKIAEGLGVQVDDLKEDAPTPKQEFHPRPGEIELLKLLRSMPKDQINRMATVFHFITATYGRAVGDRDKRLKAWKAPA